MSNGEKNILTRKS